MSDVESLTFLILDLSVMALIIVLNMAVITILILRSDTKKPKNIFLLSLALADMCVGIFVIPNVVTIMYLDVEWHDSVCKLCYYAEYTVVAASALSISVMSIDRMKAILFPLKYRSRQRTFALITLFLVWVIALLYALRTPFIYGAVTRISVVDNNVTVTEIECTIIPNMSIIHQGLVYFDFFILFVLPSGVLIVCNVAVSFKLSELPPIEMNGKIRLMMKRKKSIRLLLAMILLFMGCHLPLYVFRFVVFAGNRDIPNLRVIVQILLLLSWLNSLLNVFFYGLLNDHVRSALIAIATCNCKDLLHNRVAALHSVSTTRASNTQGRQLTLRTLQTDVSDREQS